MTNYRQTMAETLEFMYLMREYKLMERELTDGEKKKREEIAQDMDDADFKDRYGDRWKEVKMAVATKQAKKESIEEAKAEVRQLKDPRKEMMIKSKDSGVFVIDKKDFKKYERNGFFAVEEVDLDEGNLNDYVTKFKQKMGKTTYQTMTDWVDGIGGLTKREASTLKLKLKPFTEELDLDEKIVRDQSYLDIASNPLLTSQYFC